MVSIKKPVSLISADFADSLYNRFTINWMTFIKCCITERLLKMIRLKMMFIGYTDVPSSVETGVEVSTNQIFQDLTVQ